jgi:hypothetical protein
MIFNLLKTHVYQKIVFFALFASLIPLDVRAEISLSETLEPSALHDLREGPVNVIGSTNTMRGVVTIRITNSAGDSYLKKVPVEGGKFSCRYPSDFAAAGDLKPGLLFVDASESDFEVRSSKHNQAEVTIIVHGGRTQLPDFPDILTSDLLDAMGNKDEASTQWSSVRKLVNLYMRSRGARVAGIGRPAFDLGRANDLKWFQESMSFYDFANRDRDWSTPLGNRPSRTFWQASHRKWFNSSNNHPLDGNPRNQASGNYRPYGFSNDFADWLVLYWMRNEASENSDGEILEVSRDGTRNLLALQHRGSENFAIMDQSGKRENYTAGAFRYGFFVNGEFLTENTGWFYCPDFKDYIQGGVFNGRCVWGLGEALRIDPNGPLAPQLKEALRSALKFCLHDGVKEGYTKATKQGNLYWKNAGEHAYLLLGMLAAYESDPELNVPMGEGEPPKKFRDLCITSLNALVDLEANLGTWSSYPNEDAMPLPALAQGAMVFKDAPEAAGWIQAAKRVADGWLATKVDSAERTAPCVQFGYRTKSGSMSLKYMKMGRVQVYYYITGHWIHALADLYAATGEKRYLERAQALLADLCGKNPLKVRLLTETGGVYNRSDDTDGDGVEDQIRHDTYPESTAFSQIGILRLIKSLPEK